MSQESSNTYAKKPFTIEEQADLLLSRGLQADRDELTKRLAKVSYYRLKGYLHPFRQTDERNALLDTFQPHTCFNVIWNRYCFDRRLRVLMLDAIERIEVSIRTKLMHEFSIAHGAFGYCEQKHFQAMENRKYLDWRIKLEEETSRSKELFVIHFKKKYNKHHPLPIWMISELMSMGSVVTLFRNSDTSIKREIANCYGIPDCVLENWILTLYSIRNICAHHSRLWNRKLGVAPQFPNAAKSSNRPVAHGFKQNRVGSILLVCRYLLRVISPSSQWHNRVESLFLEYCEIPLPEMGMPEAWNSHPVWDPNRILARKSYHQPREVTG